jgi:hypothetical protein
VAARRGVGATAPRTSPPLERCWPETEEANREQGLSSPVVLDQQFAVGTAFGASATPSAVLVDSEGRIASEVAVGAQGVWELVRSTQTRP